MKKNKKPRRINSRMRSPLLEVDRKLGYEVNNFVIDDVLLAIDGTGFSFEDENINSVTRAVRDPVWEPVWCLTRRYIDEGL